MSAEPNSSLVPELKPDPSEINAVEQPALEGKPEGDHASKHINMKVKDMEEGETLFKINRTTKIPKVIEVFLPTQRRGLHRGSLLVRGKSHTER